MDRVHTTDLWSTGALVYGIVIWLVDPHGNDWAHGGINLHGVGPRVWVHRTRAR